MPRSRSRSRSRSPEYSVTPPPPTRRRGRSRTRSLSPRRNSRHRIPSPDRRGYRSPSPRRPPRSPSRSPPRSRRRSRSRTPPPPPRDSRSFDSSSAPPVSSSRGVNRFGWPIGASELWVGGLLDRTQESELYSLFSYYGPIEFVRIHTAKNSMRDYAFVAFRYWEDARDAAMGEDGRRVGIGRDCRYLRVQYSRGSGTKNPIAPEITAGRSASRPPSRVSDVNAMPIGGAPSVPASPASNSHASAGVMASEYRQVSSTSSYAQPSLGQASFAADSSAASMPPLEPAYAGGPHASSAGSFAQEQSGYAQGYGEMKQMERQ